MLLVIPICYSNLFNYTLVILEGALVHLLSNNYENI